MTGQADGQSKILIERLNEAKAERGLSLRDLSIDLHVTEKTVWRWLTGRTSLQGTRRHQIRAYLDSLDHDAAA